MERKFLRNTVLALCLPCMSSKHGKFTRQKGCTWWLFQLFVWWCFQRIQSQRPDSSWLFEGRFVESATDPCLALHGWSSSRVPTLTTHPHSISVCKPQTTIEWARSRVTSDIFDEGLALSPFQGPLGLMIDRHPADTDNPDNSWDFKVWQTIYIIYIPFLSFCVGNPKMWVESIWM